MNIAELKEERTSMGNLVLLPNTLRMPKGWKSFGTTQETSGLSRQARKEKVAKANKLVAAIPVCKDAGELVKEGVANFEKREAEKAKRDKAIAEGRLVVSEKSTKKTKSKVRKTH